MGGRLATGAPPSSVRAERGVVSRSAPDGCARPGSRAVDEEYTLRAIEPIRGVVDTLSAVLPLLLPLIVLQLGLLIWALVDLTRPERHVRGDNKVVWAVIIIFISLVGPLLYFIVGRES